MDAWEPTLYVRTADLAAIEAAFDGLFAEEHYARVDCEVDTEALGRSDRGGPSGARYWSLWIVGFPSGWTVVRASPAALLFDRMREGAPRFPATLAQRLGRDVLHVGLADKRGGMMLYEATPDGRTSLTGFYDWDPMAFPEEQREDDDYRAHFRIVRPPPALQEVIDRQRRLDIQTLLLVLSGAAAPGVELGTPRIYELRTPASRRAPRPPLEIDLAVALHPFDGERLFLRHLGGEAWLSGRRLGSWDVARSAPLFEALAAWLEVKVPEPSVRQPLLPSWIARPLPDSGTPAARWRLQLTEHGYLDVELDRARGRARLFEMEPIHREAVAAALARALRDGPAPPSDDLRPTSPTPLIGSFSPLVDGDIESNLAASVAGGRIVLSLEDRLPPRRQRLFLADGAGTATESAPLRGRVWALALSPDGRQLLYEAHVEFAAGRPSGAASFEWVVRDLGSGQERVVREANRSAMGGRIRWSPDGSQPVAPPSELVSPDGRCRVQVIDQGTLLIERDRAAPLSVVPGPRPILLGEARWLTEEWLVLRTERPFAVHTASGEVRPLLPSPWLRLLDAADGVVVASHYISTPIVGRLG